MSPSWKSTARRVPPARLALNSPEGSSSEAPLANVTFTALLYVSPVQIIPLEACDHTGTPRIAFDGFRHFTASTMSGSAWVMIARTRASVSARQSLGAPMPNSLRREGTAVLFRCFEAGFRFFFAAVFFFMAFP